MLPENLPQCPICAVSDGDAKSTYRSGGAYIGGGHSHQWFTCLGCNAPVLLLGEAGAAYLIFASGLYMPTETEAQEARRSSTPFSMTHASPTDWVNSVVAVTMRDWSSRREAAKKKAWLDFLPGFLERHNVKEDAPGCIRYHELPTQAAKDEIDERHKHENDLPGFEDSPPLPRIPSGVFVLRHTREGWETQGTHASWDLEVPPDPITVQNAAFWKDVFEKVEITGATEIPNGYHHAPNEPWFRFEVGTTTFEVGWRKRVVSITATSTSELDLTAIFEKAKADNVTFEIDTSYGTKDRPTPVHGKSVLVHAWGRDKCVEYLNALLMVARAS
jgi:hypothetical protein